MSNIDEQSTNKELVEKEELQPTEVAEEVVKEEVQPSETAEPTVEKEETPSSTETPESATEEPAKEAVVTPAATKGFDVNELVEKAKDLFQKRKIAVIGALAAVAVLIVALVGFKVYDSQPKSLLDVVQVQFSGYEESGTLTYNSEEVAAKLREIAYKKAGFSSKQATGLAQNDPVTFSEVTRDPKLATKYGKADALIRSVQFSFDKTNDLKNGDEVTFSIVTTSKSAPVKAEKKTFKVENLKEYEKVSASDLLTETPVTFAGLNGYGTISIAKNSKNETYFDFENGERPKNLKNGDKVTLNVNEAYINSLKSAGKMVDSKTVEVTVEGLKDLKDVKNFADLLKKNEDYSKSEHKNDSYVTYTLESQGSYLKVIPSEDKKSSAKISLITVYKVTKASSGFSNTTTVRYKYFGYEAFLLKDGNLDLDTASKVSDSWGTQDYEGLKSELLTNGYKEFENKKDEKKSE
ncbi:hypothetical protein QM359_07615 [Streptococcus infantis]|jgi:hypothetical protein|uniref:hypothetical protein n=1 Tax=Streptococcus infantis TaxID=68892 RepID=UPI0039C2F0F6